MSVALSGYCDTAFRGTIHDTGSDWGRAGPQSACLDYLSTVITSSFAKGWDGCYDHKEFRSTH